MNTVAVTAPFRPTGWLALALAAAGGVLLCERSSADDRFIVPVPDSSPSSAPSPSPPSYSGPSDSGSSSYSPPSDSGSSYSSPSDNRFIVPAPGDRPTRSHGNGGFGPGSRSSDYAYDYYSGGCYYWAGRYYYADGYYYSPYGDGFGFDRGRLPARGAYAPSYGGDRLPIFFPPTPPPLDTPAPAQALGEPGLVPPGELATYIADPFYAPLSTRLAQGNLPDPLRRRLDAYQAEKTRLLAQLHAKLAALSSAAAGAKEGALVAFAREQAPNLAALEATAERLRTDLLRAGLVGLFSGTGDWNEHRTWFLDQARLGRDSENLIPEFRVLRAAVFYQDGLTPAQRRLLREVAMELQVQAFKPTGTANAADDALLFFSPETARVRLPVDLPQELVEKVAAYRQEKSALKAQLRDALVQQDRASKAARAQALKQLGTAQTPRLAALDELAEEIRHGLAAQSNQPAVLAGPAFPPELAARIAAYQKERGALQEAVHAKLEDISRILSPTQIKAAQNLASWQGENTLTLGFGSTVYSSEKRAHVQDAVAAFNTEHRAQAAALQQALAEIRPAVAAFAAAHPEATAGKSVEVLLQDFSVATGQQEARSLYEDYEVAVYQPGLSPAQRRLLFDAALQKLALPLPGGEWQP